MRPSKILSACAPVVALVALGACSTGTSEPAVLPYPALSADAYECEDNRGCWPLESRVRFLEWVQRLELRHETEHICVLEDRVDDKTRRFACGNLLFDVMEGVTEHSFDRVKRLTNGRVTKFPDNVSRIGELQVPPGTERAAIEAIIFNRDFRYITFDYVVKAVLFGIMPPNRPLHLAQAPSEAGP